MAWRGLHLSQPARLTLADNQCVITQEQGETRLPLEDIAWIMLDTQQASLTAALLAACMEAGIALIITDARHHPNGMALHFHRHHRQAEIAAIQIAATESLRNRLWQTIIRAKITNQAALLGMLGSQAAPLYAMAERVTPGDPENIEARAARHYWQHLFADFTRQNEADLRNAMLNYGYAIMRAAIARALVAAGLLPAIGLHHASALNPFNLADDLLEPFRPIVDAMVWRLSNQGQTSQGQTSQGPTNQGALTIEHRRALASVLLEPTRLAETTITALLATEQSATSLAQALDAKSAKILRLPEPILTPS